MGTSLDIKMSQTQQGPNFQFGNAASGKIDWAAVSSLSDVSPSTLSFLSQVYTLLTFGVVVAAFTAVALYAPRGRNTLLLGGILGSGLSALLVLSIANMFVGSSTLFTAQLWGGLVLFSGFVAFDTQLIIMRAESGFRDEISAAIDLFIDVVAIFVRLLIILSKNSKNKKRDRRDRR